MAEDFWGQRLESPKNYIFGYGSLVNAQSRARTLGKHVDAIPVRISKDFGYRRAWNYPAGGFTALGLEKSDTPATINGVIYPASGDDMQKWDERESGYRRVQIPWQFVEPATWLNIPTSGHLWVYVPVNAQPPKPELPLVQSYIDVCMIGFLEYDDDFAKEFLETTFGWSTLWLNDRVQSRRPWVFLKESGTIDKFLTAYPSKGNTYKSRNHISQYEHSVGVQQSAGEAR